MTTKLLTTITLLCFSVAASAQNEESFLCTSKDDDRFVVEIGKGVRQVWSGVFNMELQDTAWLGECSVALPLEEHIICNQTVFASDSRMNYVRLIVNKTTREFVRLRAGWNAEVQLHSQAQEGSCVNL